MFVVKGFILVALTANGIYLAKSHSYIRRVKEEINILHTLEDGKSGGFVTSCIGTAFYSTILKER